MKLDKKKKIVLFLVILFLIIVGLLFFTRKSDEEMVINYIVNKGFKLNTENNLYEKRISKIDINEYYSLVDNFKEAEHDILYFEGDTFTLLEDRIYYSNGVTYIFSGTYDYKNEILTYVYEVSMENASILLEGDVKDNNIFCKVISSNNIDVNKNKKLFCDSVSYEVDDFEIFIRDLIDEPSLLEKIKSSK